jgi:hypothetical protein
MCLVWELKVDFEHNDEQRLLMTSFDGLLDRFREPGHGLGYVAYSGELQAELSASGYLDILREPEFGPLEGALLVEAVARLPVSVEVAASVLVRPLLGDLPGPVAIAWKGADRPVRFLPQARTICMIEDDAVSVGTLTEDLVRRVDSVAAYPLGTLLRAPGDTRRLSDTDGLAVRRRAMIGLAAEAAGLMRGALENTVQYVKDRVQFGQPLGHFQAIQHRLAKSTQIVRAARWLALRAAFADDLAQATIALLYAQENMRKIINDCHQFSGAMGLTLEFPLHLWTYRLKLLQGEAGGRYGLGQVAAQEIWPEVEPAPKRMREFAVAATAES